MVLISVILIQFLLFYFPGYNAVKSKSGNIVVFLGTITTRDVEEKLEVALSFISFCMCGKSMQFKEHVEARELLTNCCLRCG